MKPIAPKSIVVSICISDDFRLIALQINMEPKTQSAASKSATIAAILVFSAQLSY
jgi:hypothetical protein